MKKLGVIGGAGPLASALFYETLVYECYEMDLTMPEILLVNYPFLRGLKKKEHEKNHVYLMKSLKSCMENLERADVDMGILICNTLHLTLFKIKSPSIPFLSIPHLVLDESIKNNHKRLLLLGTQNTCLSSLYKHDDLSIFHPNSKDQQILDHIIDHVLKGKILKEDAEILSTLLETYTYEVDGVILGCTDLPVLHHHHPIKCSKTLYDSVKIPAKTLVGLL